MSDYHVRLCPVCLEQLEDEEACWHGEYGGAVEAIAVVAVADQAHLNSQRGLALFRLQEDRRDADFAEGERRWYENLSVADRFWEDERRKKLRREQLAAMSPMDRAFVSMVSGWGPSLARQLYSDRPLLLFGPQQLPPDALDDWLAGEGGVPEVAEALAL